ncbi:MAG: HPr(Ser) kinase/phosphatase [Acidobacteria bacterium]|nr:HPr(Ser) kinase/phosphatase [Acidobacteriota bacterium]
MISKGGPVTTELVLKDPRLAGLRLELVAGQAGLSSILLNPRLQKPGLALAGYLEYVKEGRVQVIGASESEFLTTLAEDVVEERVNALVALRPPLLVITKGMRRTAGMFTAACELHGVALAVSEATTSVVIERLSSTLEFLLAPREIRHGDLLDIFAIGVLILGESGSGKSECALELVHRGHRLVADDIVEIYRVRGEDLVGQAPEEVRGLMEVRGLGLISIEQLFGVVSVRDNKPIDLVIKLVSENTVHLDRLGLAESSEEILGLVRPCLTVPVAPGRSLSLLVECAARKYLLSQRGVPDAAREYLLRHDRRLERP